MTIYASSFQPGTPPIPPLSDLPRHRRALRRALLAKHGALSRHRLGLFFFFPMKRVLPVAGLGVALFLVANTFLPLNTLFVAPVAHAQELVNRAVKKLPSIPTEVRSEIEKRIKSDMAATLAEAKAAPDLRILTAEEFNKEMAEQAKLDMQHAKIINKDQKFYSTAPSAFGITVSSTNTESVDATQLVTIDATKIVHGIVNSSETSSSSSFNWTTGTSTQNLAIHFSPVELKQPVKYLSYTDPRGQSVVLGLDEDDVPVMKMVKLTIQFDEGGQGVFSSGTMHFIQAEHLEL